LKKILHISFDYAEDYSQNNIGKSTTVISDLIKSVSDDYVNYVISLNRTINFSRQYIKQISDNHIHLISFGLPFALFLKSSMLNFAKKILRYSSETNLELNQFDLIHSHKLTFEGIIGYHLAKSLKRKLFVSIRQTDFFVMKYRTYLIPYFKEILSYSSQIFYIAPYMKKKLLEVFGKDFYYKVIERKLTFLPNRIQIRNFSFSEKPRLGNLITILWMNKHTLRRKNILNLFKAIKKLNNPSIKLDVIGDGDYLEKVKRWAKRLEISSQINFLGFKQNKEIEAFLSDSCGFVLPSHSESFGVVYAESLVTGTPILYTKGTGFDGLFENVGPKVNSKSVFSIAEGIKDLISNNELYRLEIKKLFESGAFKIFTSEFSNSTYKKCIESL
jgi:hypothetical protein